MTEQRPMKTGFGPFTTAEEVARHVDLRGRTAVITGGHSGVGLETTKVLARAGANIYVAARDVKKAEVALAKIENVRILHLDLADPKSIYSFTSHFLKEKNELHLLINNAGVMALPELSRDARGYEMQFATNHLGHFQLTEGLWPALKSAAGARVINLTSAGHRFAAVDLEDPNFLHRPYDKWKSYGQSKTANSLFSVELDRRGRAFGIRAFAVHPGRIIETDLIRHLSEADVKAALANSTTETKNIPQGAATTVWCAVSASLENQGGVYCADCDVSAIVADESTDLSGVRNWAIDPVIARSLWGLSEKMISIS